MDQVEAEGDATVIVELVLGGAVAVSWAARGYKTTPFDALFVHYGDARGIDPDLLRAIAKVESAYRPEVINGTRVSSTGAIGLMQVMPATAKLLGFTPAEMTIPEKAIDAATKLLRSDRSGLVAKARYTLNAWIATYNAGLPRVLSIGEAAAEAGYVANVLKHFTLYKAAGIVFNRR